jgi:hypothetical protein
MPVAAGLVQLFNEPYHILFEQGQGGFSGSAIHVINMPVVDAICPVRKTLGQQGAMFDFLEGNDEMGRREILLLQLQGTAEGLG